MPPPKLYLPNTTHFDHRTPLFEFSMQNPPLTPFTPGTNHKVTALLNASFASWEKEAHLYAIPKNPLKWTEEQVQRWLCWTSKEFAFSALNLSAFYKLNGADMIGLGKERFLIMTPPFTGDILWEHLDLLQKDCELEYGVATQLKYAKNPALSCFNNTGSPLSSTQLTVKQQLQTPMNAYPDFFGIQRNLHYHPMPTYDDFLYYKAYTPFQMPLLPRNQSATVYVPALYYSIPPSISYSPRTCHVLENTSPIQLWQFLLDLLTDKTKQHFIAWTGVEWEFKFTNPNKVARLWGLQKNKPKMDYEKLSRSLRYYYNKKIIQKTAGRRYVYRFVCGLEKILSCSPEDFRTKHGLRTVSRDGG